MFHYSFVSIHVPDSIIRQVEVCLVQKQFLGDTLGPSVGESDWYYYCKVSRSMRVVESASQRHCWRFLRKSMRYYHKEVLSLGYQVLMNCKTY
jgi:hypothetical protein